MATQTQLVVDTTTETGENQAEESQQPAERPSLFVPAQESSSVQESTQEAPAEDGADAVRSTLLGVGGMPSHNGPQAANGFMNLPFHEAQNVNNANGTTSPSFNQGHSTNETNDTAPQEQDQDMTDETGAEEGSGTNTSAPEIPQENTNPSNGETEEGPSENAENENGVNGATGGGGGPPNDGGSTSTNPNLDPPPSRIDISVKDSDGNITFFRIRRNSLLRKVFTAFAGQRRQENQALRFLYDGERLSGSETPDTLEMENGDIIEVVLEQFGGH